MVLRRIKSTWAAPISRCYSETQTCNHPHVSHLGMRFTTIRNFTPSIVVFFHILLFITFVQYMIDILMSAVLTIRCFMHCAKKPVTTMLTYPWNVQFYIVTTWETPGNHWCWWPNTLIITLASTRAIIKVSRHQHQWFPGVSQVVTM